MGQVCVEGGGARDKLEHPLFPTSVPPGNSVESRSLRILPNHSFQSMGMYERPVRG